MGTGHCFQTLQEHTATVAAVQFSPDGQILASGSDDETIRLWEVKSGTCLKVLRADRPYERLNISSATGLSEAQKATLKTLGAVEE
jgi:WD40 repeat protein